MAANIGGFPGNSGGMYGVSGSHWLGGSPFQGVLTTVVPISTSIAMPPWTAVPNPSVNYPIFVAPQVTVVPPPTKIRKPPEILELGQTRKIDV